MERSYRNERKHYDAADADIMVTSRPSLKKEKPQEKLMNEQGFEARVKPRSVNAGAAVDTPGRISANLEILNKRYVSSPARPRMRTITAAPPMDGVLERRRERVRTDSISADKTRTKPAVVRSTTKRYVVTRTVAKKKTFPLFSLIVCCVILACSFFYLFHLNVEADDYKENISKLQSEIVELKDEKTLLQVKFDAKYNLPLVSRLAVEEFGMVNADSLPKKYVTLASSDSIQVFAENNEHSSSWLAAVASIFRDES
jgi:hypothetical protein